jgi:protease IV
MSENETGNSGEQKSENWERDLLNRLSFASLAEQRRARRWSIFFKLLISSYILIVLVMAMRGSSDDGSARFVDHTAIIEINGLISDATRANADTIIEGLRNAFASKHTKGVVLRINSPGGSPVQADYVYREIVRMKQEHPNIPVHAVIADIGASGAYYIASAADNIYVNPSSIVGSIGVLMNGFGFVDVMKKVGVERRLLTSGEHKGMLDPFQPLKKGDVKHVKSVLDDVHREFIAAVKAGRGERLGDDPNLYSGMFWSGIKSIELGLADEIGDVDYVAREVIKAEDVVDYTPQPDMFKRFADRIGASMANVMVEKMGINPIGLQ